MKQREFKHSDYSGLAELWNRPNKDDWIAAKQHYWDMDSVQKHLCLERKLNEPDYVLDGIKTNFLWFISNEYIQWKYSGCFVSRKIENIKMWSKEDGDNASIKLLQYIKRIQNTEQMTEDLIREGIEVKKIFDKVGIGVAGISGLLTLAVPEKFGTVDRFVAKALMKVNAINNTIKNPSSLTIMEAVTMEKAMMKKAEKLNRLFGGNEWRPRDIDMVLWSYGR